MPAAYRLVIQHSTSIQPNHQGGQHAFGPSRGGKDEVEFGVCPPLPPSDLDTPRKNTTTPLGKIRQSPTLAAGNGPLATTNTHPTATTQPASKQPATDSHHTASTQPLSHYLLLLLRLALLLCYVRFAAQPVDTRSVCQVFLRVLCFASLPASPISPPIFSLSPLLLRTPPHNIPVRFQSPVAALSSRFRGSSYPPKTFLSPSSPVLASLFAMCFPPSIHTPVL
ncbi:hypothetical protein PAAG_11404 [Paracoccidioides lutzii Pb01]|uniref:Uncharacterized protein n=1 Tax=Paracoccidioides lutzii (strain ATCC MYA-826 / Pb01) TaxID=502779 RepID=A0A0A2VLU6_PARBA|nr:hypothetical protein PAAG_11404 [Paracoccidioides lutzii Pb01]KGQ01829.1 hypothetical protein PAAG_11404 [Paracoccidioides lutzii Pb01]